MEIEGKIIEDKLNMEIENKNEEKELNTVICEKNKQDKLNTEIEEKNIEEEFKMEIEEFLGKKYVMVKQEHFEDYLLFLGKGYLARKAALNLYPVLCLTRNDDGETYTFSFSSLLANYELIFTPGEEFEEVKPDGKVKSVITFEDNKMTHIQTDEKGRVSRHVREYFHDKMITTTTAEGLDKTVIRYHELVQ